MSLRMGALFAGYEGLGLGVADVLDVELAWVSEIEDAPSWILAHHYPHVPNHGDITQIDWTQVEPVAVLTAGYPCQPFSNAGQRRGVDDERYLWPEVARAIRDLGPRLVVLENVAAHVNRGFSHVLGSLAELGYDAEWTCLRAADVGAPHGRNRLFVVAWPADTESTRLEARRHGQPARRSAADADDIGQQRGRGTRRRRQGSTDGSVPAADAAGVRGGALRPTGGEPHGADRPCGERERAAADAGGARFGEQPGSAPAGEARPGAGHVAASDRGARPAVEWGPYRPAIERWEHVLGRYAPAPTEPGRTGKPRLSPRFVEWLMGLDDGWVTAVPGISRNDQLKALGNGVVPQQASEALRHLLEVDRQGVAA